jgi:hypothetical protein
MTKEKMQKLMATNDLVSSFTDGFTASIMLLLLSNRSNLIQLFGYSGIVGSIAVVIVGKSGLINKITKKNNLDRIINLVLFKEVTIYNAMSITGIYSFITKDISTYIYMFMVYVVIATVLSGCNQTYKQIRREVAFGSTEEFAAWTQGLATNSNLVLIIGAAVNLLLLNVIAPKIGIDKVEMARYMFGCSIFMYFIDTYISILENKHVREARKHTPVTE